MPENAMPMTLPRRSANHWVMSAPPGTQPTAQMPAAPSTPITT